MLRDVERCWETLRDIERYWEILRDIEKYWDVLREYERYWKLFRDIERYWEILRGIERFWEILRDIEKYWDVLIDNERYLEILEDIERYWDFVIDLYLFTPVVRLAIFPIETPRDSVADDDADGVLHFASAVLMLLVGFFSIISQFQFEKVQTRKGQRFECTKMFWLFSIINSFVWTKLIKWIHILKQFFLFII